MEERIKELGERRERLFVQIKEIEERIGSFEDEIRLRRLKEYKRRLKIHLRKYFSKNFKARADIVILEPGDVNLWGIYKKRLFASLSIERALFSREAQAFQDAAELKGFLQDRLASSSLEEEEEKRELMQIIEDGQ